MSVQSIHFYDHENREVYYRDGRIERVPEEVVRGVVPGREVDVVASWAKSTRRIGDKDELAVIAT